MKTLRTASIVFLTLCASLNAEEKIEYFIAADSAGGHLKRSSYTGMVIEGIWTELPSEKFILQLFWTGKRDEENLKAECIQAVWPASFQKGRTIVSGERKANALVFTFTMDGEKEPYYRSKPYPITQWVIHPIDPKTGYPISDADPSDE